MKMGAAMYRPIPRRTYNSEEGFCSFYYFGANQITGWRQKQEDRYICLPKFHGNFSMFAVYDGHGGEDVSQYLLNYLHHLVINELKLHNDPELALYLGFLTCDMSMRSITEEVFYAIQDEIDIEIEVPDREERRLLMFGKRTQKNSVGGSESGNCDDAVDGPDSAGSSSSVCQISEKFRSEIASACFKELASLKFLTAAPLEDDESDESYDPEEEEEEEMEEDDDDSDCQILEDDHDGISHEKQDGNTAKNDVDSAQNKKVESSTDNKDKGNVNAKKQVKGDSESGKSSPIIEEIDLCSESEDGEVKDKKQNEADEETKDKKQNEADEETKDKKQNEADEDTKDKKQNEADEDTKDKKQNEADEESKAKKQNEADEESKDEEQNEADEESMDEEQNEADEESDSDSDELQSFGKHCGSTATVLLFDQETLYVANVGDSRCVACVKGEAVDLSIDHKPFDAEEKQRIVNAGGSVSEEGRVNDNLDMSRALGDFDLKNKTVDEPFQILSCEPSIKKLPITPELEFVIIASDGIWNSMNSNEVIHYLSSRLKDRTVELRDICGELFEEILPSNITDDGSGCDNMTAILIRFGSSNKNLGDKNVACQETYVYNYPDNTQSFVPKENLDVASKEKAESENSQTKLST